MVSKNHGMHLNPLYDRKTDLGQPTQFRKKKLKRVGEHCFMAQINARFQRRQISMELILKWYLSP